MEYPFIFGTAGHIDHGKTSLVKAMTGIDCDRLEEEKRRGITIELGFASLGLPDGRTVSIVDVPGHERFIRQMAAGASGMDAAMLVIAASEGVMPQTREHLDILNILGVRFGLVALTKKDLADDETLELAAGEAAELIQGTCLEGAAIIPVSSATGEGVPLIIEEITRILDRIPPRKGFGAFFLPIDRVFSKKGFGSVITGASYQGTVREGDEVEIMPSGSTARVRSLQTHGAKVSSVSAGQRVAVNLTAVSHELLEKGGAVCAKGAFTATDCMSAWLDVLPSAAAAVAHRQRVRLHIGTADVIARISLLTPDAGEKKAGIAPGAGGPVQILCESEIAVAAGQRFVIRFYSPLITIGGGRIMLPDAEPARGRAERRAKAGIVRALAGDFSPVPLLAAIVRDRGILNRAGLFALSQMERDAFNEHSGALSGRAAEYGLIEFGKAGNFITNEAFDTVAGAAVRLLQKFHAKFPELAGLDGEKLYSALDSVHGAGKAGRLSAGDFRELAGMMAGRGVFSPVTVQGKTCYRLPDFTPSADSKFMALIARVRDELAAAGFNLPKLPELEEKMNVPAADLKRAAVYLREQGELWLLEGTLVFSRAARDKLLEVLASMKEDITVGVLRDLIGVNRKYALSMLEFLDSQGLTRRTGDKRVLVKE